MYLLIICHVTEKVLDSLEKYLKASKTSVFLQANEKPLSGEKWRLWSGQDYESRREVG